MVADEEGMKVSGKTPKGTVLGIWIQKGEMLFLEQYASTFRCRILARMHLPLTKEKKVFCKSRREYKD